MSPRIVAGREDEKIPPIKPLDRKQTSRQALDKIRRYQQEHEKERAEKSLAHRAKVKDREVLPVKKGHLRLVGK